MDRLAEIKGSVSSSMTTAEGTQAQRAALFKKSRKLNKVNIQPKYKN